MDTKERLEDMAESLDADVLTAPVEEVEAELRAAGGNPEAIVARNRPSIDAMLSVRREAVVGDVAEAWALVIADRTDSVYLSRSMATTVARGHQRDRDDVTVVPLVRAAECDRLLDKVAALTVENTDLKEQRAVFGEDLDRAFLDGYGAAYIKARPGRFVPMTEYADEAADALTEWHKDNGDTVDNACVGCGVSIDEGRTHCGSLECGSGSIER